MSKKDSFDSSSGGMSGGAQGGTESQKQADVQGSPGDADNVLNQPNSADDKLSAFSEAMKKSPNSEYFSEIFFNLEGTFNIENWLPTILGINPDVNPEELVRLTDALNARDGATVNNSYVAARLLLENPDLNADNYIQFTDKFNKLLSQARLPNFPINLAEILKIDPNADPERLAKVIIDCKNNQLAFPQWAKAPDISKKYDDYIISKNTVSIMKNSPNESTLSIADTLEENFLVDEIKKNVNYNDIDHPTAYKILKYYKNVDPSKLGKFLNALDSLDAADSPADSWRKLLGDAPECYLNAALCLRTNPNIDCAKLVDLVRKLKAHSPNQDASDLVKYAATLLKDNPDIAPEKAVSLAAALDEYSKSDFPYLKSLLPQLILKINPNVDPKKLVELTKAITPAGIKTEDMPFMKAAEILRYDPNFPDSAIEKYNQLSGEFNTTLKQIAPKYLHPIAVLNIDPNVKPDQIIKMILAWHQLVNEQITKFSENGGLDEKQAQELRHDFLKNLAVDSARVLKGKPDVDPENIVNMMRQFEEFALGVDAAATILNNNQNIDRAKMLDLMKTFQNADLDCVTAAEILKINPQVDIQRMSEIMEKCKVLDLDYYAAATILAAHPNVNIDTMANVGTRFLAAFLERLYEPRDKHPTELDKAIEPHEEDIEITKQFGDAMLMDVAKTVEQNPAMSPDELLEKLGVTEESSKADDLSSSGRPTWTQATTSADENKSLSGVDNAEEEKDDDSLTP